VGVSKEEAAQRIEELRQQIRYHEKKYYVDNDPQISDYEFDCLVKELERLEGLYPELISPDSPTQRVGEQPVEGFPSVNHSVPMLSLDNCYNREEFLDFVQRIEKLLPGQKVEFVTELKIDGLGIAIIYRNGHYAQAITRGDGFRGDDVSANVKTIRSLPLSISLKDEVEVRGEIYLPFTSFEKINQEREEKGEFLFANPRNAAAGTIRLLDPKEVAQRNLDIFLYYIFVNGQPQESQWENLQLLKKLGFKINPHVHLCHSVKEVIDYYEYWKERRDELDYDVDALLSKLIPPSSNRLWVIPPNFPVGRLPINSLLAGPQPALLISRCRLAARGLLRRWRFLNRCSSPEPPSAGRPSITKKKSAARISALGIMC